MNLETILVSEELCTGCLRCRLACSELYTRSFCPEEARIEVDLSGTACSIRFTDECTMCGVCVDACFYDALRKEPGENKE